MIFKRLTLDDPTVEPVSVDEARARLVHATAEEEDELQRLIRAAREIVEHRTDRQLMPATLQGVSDEFPCKHGGEILVEQGLPLRSVSEIRYFDTDGVEQTLSPSLYQCDAFHNPGRIKPARGQWWPATRSGIYGAVTIETLNGFVDADENPAVPQVAKDAILFLVGKWTERLGVPGNVDEAWREEFDRVISPLLWH